MRQETILKTYLKFDELNDKQKAIVLDKQRDINTSHDWHDHVIEETTNFLNILGFRNVDIKFSGFCSQGDGASFTGTFFVPPTQADLEARTKLVYDLAPQYNLFDYLLMSFDDDEIESDIVIESICLRYSHSNTVWCHNKHLKSFVKAFSDELYSTLENEYFGLQEDVSVIETITDNDYEFDSETLEIV